MTKIRNYFNMLLKAASVIDNDCKNNNFYSNDSDNDNDNVNDIILSQPKESSPSKLKLYRTNTGQFISKKWDNKQSKYIGVYINDGRWTVNIAKVKTRFNTLQEAEQFFIEKCKKLKINYKLKIREGFKKN